MPPRSGVHWWCEIWGNWHPSKPCEKVIALLKNLPLEPPSEYRDIQMFQTCPVVKWSGFWMVVSKLDQMSVLRSKMVCQITRSDHLKTKQESVWLVKLLDFMCLVFRWLIAQPFEYWIKWTRYIVLLCTSQNWVPPSGSRPAYVDYQLIIGGLLATESQSDRHPRCR